MKIIQPSVEILSHFDHDDALMAIERASRTCYKSEENISPNSAAKMVGNLIKRGHTAMLEHYSVTVKFICDRGVTHEIVRHRVASYAQESTRYCNYSGDKFGKQITVIDPSKAFSWDFNKQADCAKYQAWHDSIEASEKAYMEMLENGASPQEARSVLPNSLKTEIVVTMNLREWIHFFNLRAVGTTGAPHPQMKQVAIMALKKMARILPEVFEEQINAVT